MRKRSAGSLEAETLRQKIGDETLLWAFFPFVKDDGTRPEFIDDLAAGAAGRTWDSAIASVGGDEGHGANLEFWTIFSDSGKDRSTFGAVGHSVRGVLDVASHEDLSFRGKDSRAHSKVGKGCVRVFHDLACRPEQAFARGNWHLSLLHIQINFDEEQEGASVTPKRLGRR